MAGLKVVVFSASCEAAVRETKKGLCKWEFKVESSKLK
jgi:hypothetical protein